ncbi:glycoside hydrolase family 2 TIM barrel-domain containing protein [Flammeovirga aprica]|uniref:Glycoside hydrolase family 2 protein n=1 Tax=Flammeovirga aprica JL-4 TaxID=694437 RepID=A0A7X9RSY3_9BACT|nr:glycoside hydrolase family 2 TIM barrel-domain containing protein [Flammeovirga aprica]NME66557.1 glycoside hydrolase family 2 protein [Flammeovirga aprica JL-4]
MKKIKIYSFLFLLFALLGACNTKGTSPRITADFNGNWQFYWADSIDAEMVEKDKVQWNEVTLPHDWSIEMDYTHDNTAGCTGYLPGGIGWYKKTFTVPSEAKNKKTWIEFDGIYRDSKIWVNGKYVGGRPYGYAAFKIDLTDHLNYGETANEIIVKVNRKAFMDARWYPGSGIYRNVKLVTVNPVHIAHWGTFVTTPEVSKVESKVAIKTSIINEEKSPKSIKVTQQIKDAKGKVIQSTSSKIQLKEGENSLNQELLIEKPFLWSDESPNLYQMLTTLESEGEVLDEYTTTFGVRSIRFDAQKGFFLNGENKKLKGVCLHNDAGAVGSAVPIDVWKRRLRILKEAGVNAIRTAHNPASADFMDLCDEMGFLVQAEAFDEWTVNKNKWIDDKPNAWKYDFGEKTTGYAGLYEEWAERDLKDMIRRDRNHPSVIMWSIGNEIEWTFGYYWKTAISNQADFNKVLDQTSGGNLQLVALARQLHQWIKEEDTTRPSTAGEVLPQAGNLTGYCDAVDVTGYNYQSHHYDAHHEAYPDRVIYGSENFAQWQEWKDCLERDYISGVFLWPGISYLGETSGYPSKALDIGLMDIAGFKNPVYHFFKTFWQEKPVVYFGTQKTEASHYLLENGKVVENPEKKRPTKWHWATLNSHWNYQNDESVYIEAYTNAEEVELFLNDKSLGKRALKENEDRILKWIIPYQKGKIKAVAKTKGSVVAEYEIKTAEKPQFAQLNLDQQTVKANGKDVVHVVAQLHDVNGNPVKHIDKEVRFKVKGNAKIIGIDNGLTNNTNPFKADHCMTSKGRVLLLVQAGKTEEKVVVEALMDDIVVGESEFEMTF